MAGMYEMFGADKDLERNGIWFDYGDFQVLAARAGGANRKYERLVERKSKQHQALIRSDNFSNEQVRELLKEVYADAIILDWRVKAEKWPDHEADGDWVRGIEGPDGTLLELNKPNVIQTFNNLPDLFDDILERTNKSSLYRLAVREERAGN